MSGILPFLRLGTSFGPEDLAVLGAAFDAVTERLGRTSLGEAAQQLIAAEIVALASGGRIDADYLSGTIVDRVRSGRMRLP